MYVLFYVYTNMYQYVYTKGSGLLMTWLRTFQSYAHICACVSVYKYVPEFVYTNMYLCMCIQKFLNLWWIRVFQLDIVVKVYWICRTHTLNCEFYPCPWLAMKGAFSLYAAQNSIWQLLASHTITGGANTAAGCIARLWHSGVFKSLSLTLFLTSYGVSMLQCYNKLRIICGYVFWIEIKICWTNYREYFL